MSTSHCHLCEQAEALLSGLVTKSIFKWVVVEIIDDSVLYDRYATTIPVLKNINSNQEISWPFTSSDIEILITA
jgi:hypothetical protein